MFLADRTDELMFRAANREITAIVTLSLPGIDPKAGPESMGAIIQGRKLYTPRENTSVAFSQAANVWQFDDRCAPEIGRSPALLEEIKRELYDRTKKLNAEEMKGVGASAKAAIFDSEDLISKGTGIPPKISIDFAGSPERAVLAVSVLPFENLKKYLVHLVEKADEAGGGLHDVTITHRSAISAADYHQLPTLSFHQGARLSAGDFMIGKAQWALANIGIPHGNDRPKPRYH